MNEALANWIPSSVLVVVSLALISLLWKKADTLLDKIIARLEAVERQAHTFATIEQLGRACDRLDGRTTNNSERLAVLEALRHRSDSE